MSRRGRHGRHGHHGTARPAEPASPSFDRAPGVADARAVPERPVLPAERASIGPLADAALPAPAARPNGNGHRPAEPQLGGPAAATPVAPASPSPAATNGAADPRSTCTTAQLRRFIKSRPWVPMHELRRRFGIWGADDDVTPIRVGDTTLYIGLPESESRMIAELLTGGDVGYELSLDPGAPIVVGVYPMRPVPRS